MDNLDLENIETEDLIELLTTLEGMESDIESVLSEGEENEKID